ncbi:MAG: hypothetical protein QXU79_02385 [Candidatus Micrarchaeaceae archaeon]
MLIVIGQGHEGGNILPQADRVNEGEVEFAGREGSEEAKSEGLYTPYRGLPASDGHFPEQGLTTRERQQRWHVGEARIGKGAKTDRTGRQRSR